MNNYNIEQEKSVYTSIESRIHLNYLLLLIFAALRNPLFSNDSWKSTIIPKMRNFYSAEAHSRKEGIQTSFERKRNEDEAEYSVDDEANLACLYSQTAVQCRTIFLDNTIETVPRLLNITLKLIIE